MALRFGGRLGKEAFYLCGYFALLLFSLSGLMLQGNVWFLVAAVCWVGVVAIFFVGVQYSYRRKCLRAESLEKAKSVGR
jgi:hypothetical protein